MNPKSSYIKEKFVSEAVDFAVKLTKILQKDTRYDAEAYSFLMAALHHTLSKLKEHRHLSGRELLEGIRECGLRNFGPMARTVFLHWGIKDTSDFGEIVFNLVGVGLMRKRPEDTKEEFEDVYDFETAFDKPFQRSISPKLSRRQARKKTEL